MMIPKYIEEYGHVMMSMSGDVHDRAQHDTKMFIWKKWTVPSEYNCGIYRNGSSTFEL